MMTPLIPCGVIPAKAGNHSFAYSICKIAPTFRWVPAFAGMTELGKSNQHRETH
jgi:hypothetical protein